MPYRRLPNTDQARLRALKNAIKQAEKQTYGNQILLYKTQNEAQSFLNIFENQIVVYKQMLQNQVNANKQYQQVLYNARMYISHFIQVLNLAVIRGDIKKEQKSLYQLDLNTHNVPDLSTETAILNWGKSIIEGENERTRNGGFPIYNPSIGKVQVHLEVFKEYKMTQKLYQSTTNRNWEELVKLRQKADEIILDIWNQVEEFYKDETPYNKLIQCQKYGLIYYYRKNEQNLTPDN
ncbi:conserved hypothetical protein [uncultured Paludibacter sp.]|uniref:Uncharacterized protein n=1 Tax=uncultured Paludibacter sp. TaxID=497635 RepID=A0A653AH96_9BACT|nr:conserved hypothetical protein [uncultured Paludibacter sp.]